MLHKNIVLHVHTLQLVQISISTNRTTTQRKIEMWQISGIRQKWITGKDRTFTATGLAPENRLSTLKQALQKTFQQFLRPG